MAEHAVELGHISIFAELDKSELGTVERLLRRVDAKPAKVLTEQGKPGREFVIIEDGTARVEIDGRVVAHLGPGEFVGELSLITGDPRNATVIATSDMTLRVLNRTDFDAMLDESPKITKKIMIAAVRRVMANENGKLD